MKFLIQCFDKPDSLDLRLANRPAHLAYIDGLADRILAAGPMLGDDDATPVGSLLIMEWDSRADAEAFAADDPYNKAGLFARVEIRAWKQVHPKA